ncbi:endothelin-converting enzyme 1-like isoform X11 [Leptopilina boulardi]|uniref:endothelin-converting enzyme 1-like isoform X11 n=1 Tax=Leptopilina boulardi TaxID=63433 RepID=UPI0021F53737|nr:endothelin-converting enzyme 1-like isoform X11 [Leptopilina boulardi]
MFQSIYFVFFGSLVIVNSFKIIEDKTPTVERNVKNDIAVCKTKECYNIAEFIKKGMNDTVNPCDDFYSYLCGSWQTNFPTPEKKLKWDLNAITNKKIYTVLKEILQKPSSSEDNKLLALEKKWFKSCMDEDSINKRGLEPLRNIIEKVGGLPLLMNTSVWEKKEITWQNVAQYYANILGEYDLFNIEISPDLHNSTTQTIMIDQTSDIRIEFASFINKEISYNHKQFISYNSEVNNLDKVDDANPKEKIFMSILKFISAYSGSEGGRDEKEIINDIQNLIDFHYSLEKIKTPVYEIDVMELGNNKITISEFQKHYNRKQTGSTKSMINLLEFIQVLFKNSDVVIDESEEIYVMDKLFFDKLGQLLEATPERTIVNYIHARFIGRVNAYLDKPTSQILPEIFGVVMGVPFGSERWEICINNMPLKNGISMEFMKSQVPNVTIQTAKEMAEEIRKEINTEISNSNWMNNETKSLAMNKLKLMEYTIGHPKWYSSSDFSEKYNGLKIGPDYFDNAIHYFKYVKSNSATNFRKPFDKYKWEFPPVTILSPVTLNALYYNPTNTINIPAAQLLTSFFDANIPLALNYGSVGYVIGHEMSHGFDAFGRHLDGNGNFISSSSGELIREYKKKDNCIVDQYNNYKVDGKETRYENFADAGGLNAAYGAYKEKIKKDKIKEQSLPGLKNLDSDQLFFVGFGAKYCESGIPSYLTSKSSDAHTENPSRVNGAVANVKGFSEAFKCQKEPMCSLWN